MQSTHVMLYTCVCISKALMTSGKNKQCSCDIQQHLPAGSLSVSSQYYLSECLTVYASINSKKCLLVYGVYLKVTQRKKIHS